MNKRIITIGIIILLSVFFIGGCNSYNQLVSLDESVKTSWSQVENQYQRRADLIPNLVSTVKGYARHEQETLTAVIEARAKATSTNINANNLDETTLAQYQQKQDALSSALSRLMVVVEKYPDLKANEQFKDLQVQLEGTENRIATARRDYNEATRVYNLKVRAFPSNIYASTFGFKSRPYFQAEEQAHEAPKVDFGK